MSQSVSEPGQGRSGRELEVMGACRRGVCSGGDLFLPGGGWGSHPGSLPVLPVKAHVEGTSTSASPVSMRPPRIRPR